MRSVAAKRFITFALLVVAVYILPGGISEWLRNTTFRLVQPLGHALIVRNAGLHNAYNSFKQLGSLREDKSHLERQVLTLQQTVSDHESIKRENELLRKEVGVTGVTHDQKKVLARVIVRDPDPLDQTVTVDVGTADGIELDQAAVSQGALIGKVIEVREHSAVIRTLSSQKSKIQVWLVESREKGLLEGIGTGIELTDITQGVAVPERSVIETSGLGGSLPQGIVVGQTSSTTSKQSDLSQTFSVTPSQDLQGLESFFILIGG